MIISYSYPGSQSFAVAQLYDNSKKSKEAAKNWWNNAHKLNGTCAPGGGGLHSDRDAGTWRYRDGKRVIDFSTEATVMPVDTKVTVLPGWELKKYDGFWLLCLTH